MSRIIENLNLRKIFKNKLFVPLLFIVNLIVFLARFVLQTVSRTYISDDVVNFDLFLNNFVLKNNTYYFPNDPFFLKIPIYKVFTEIFGITFTTLDLINITAFIILILSLVIITIKYKQSLIVVILPLFITSSFYITFWNNPIIRNFEITLSIIILFTIINILKNNKISFIKYLLLTIFFAVFWLNDPYFLFTYGISLILTILCLMYIKKDRVYRFQLAKVIASIIFSIGLYKIFSLILTNISFIIYPNVTKFVRFDNLKNNLDLTILGIQRIFNIDFWGQDIFSIYTVIVIITIILISFLAKKFVNNAKDKESVGDTEGKRLLKIFSIIMIVLLLLEFIFSQNAVSIESSRYFIYLPVAISLFILGVNTIYSKNFIIIVSLLVLLLNSLAFYSAFKNGTFTTKRNSYEINVANALINSSIKKGFSDYWTGGITNYILKYEKNLVPFICSEGKIHLYPMLTDNNRIKEKVDKSFIILDFNKGYSKDCTFEKVVNQYGKPDNVVNYDGGTVLYYNYDIIIKDL